MKLSKTVELSKITKGRLKISYLKVKTRSNSDFMETFNVQVVRLDQSNLITYPHIDLLKIKSFDRI